ncbi:hypothetical protein QR680_006124 [Steinernema hermaphroditum]|uniref:Uncharacterized protein n=1 Tax=Steinernema hermaphroditum TaxID=289476 RepID=A0AA39HVR2_9BILA|nr:hypothetical protein QR680_006124 [Steinernema hermaphroditum]
MSLCLHTQDVYFCCGLAVPLLKPVLFCVVTVGGQFLTKIKRQSNIAAFRDAFFVFRFLCCTMAEVLQKRTDPRTIIKEKNAIKAQRAREKYHSMSEEKRKTYNKKRNIYWIRQKEREARILQKKLSEASAQDLEHLEKIIEERERRAEAQRRRYYTKSFEERRAMNHKLYLKRKKQQYGSSTSGALAGAYNWSVDREAMRDVSKVFPLILSLVTFGSSTSVSDETCSLRQLQNIYPFRKTIIYAITPDCHLHVFRSWNHSLNLNSISYTPIRKSFCAFDKNSRLIHFVHRQHQMPALLIIIIRLSTNEYPLLEFNLEELLGDLRETTVPLIEHIHKSTTKVIEAKEPIASCTFVSTELFCFWVDAEKRRVFQQKFEFEEELLRYRPRKDAVPFDKAGIRYLSQKVIASVWDQEQLESASVFLYDPITKGWLYRVSNTSFPAGRQRRKNMHHIHTTQGKLMNLASMGNSVLMATECDAAGGCRYIVNFLQIMAFSPHACVFKSETLMAVGLLTDVRSEDPQDTEGKDVSPVILTPEQVEHRRPVSQGYEPIIALATHSLANLHQAEDICAAKAS